VPIPASVPALIPLSLLEAIRNLDTPVEDGLEELAEEIVVRRLGLSPTVAAQIQRYREVAEKDGGIELDEVVSVVRLVGRRADAPLVFADAGRRAARYAARSRARPARVLARLSPGGIGKRIALGAAARLARDIFGGELRAESQGSDVSMAEPLSILAIPDGAACAFYGSAYGELLRGLTAFEGAMLHEQCRARGGAACVWRSAAAEVYE
jgi:bacteriochlorophyll 4-vinyl reductase